MTDRTLPMPQLPDAITIDQARAVLDVLGLPHTVRTLTLHATEGVTVTLLARDTDGRVVKVGDDALYITAHIPHGDAARTPEGKAQHYIGQYRWCCEMAFLTLGEQHVDDCTREQ
ncbi:hypothetical protein ACIP96_06405 [Streptomyces nigra]|uniref:hypothetical protein n=1 Tax=Streptomyces nigra TaxID=1827580 RepID=UPI0038215C0F